MQQPCFFTSVNAIDSLSVHKYLYNLFGANDENTSSGWERLVTYIKVSYMLPQTFKKFVQVYKGACLLENNSQNRLVYLQQLHGKPT